MHTALKLIIFVNMSSIVKYISDLLYHHDCVIVTGLGGFVANPKRAEVEHSQHLFMPPVKEVGFNRSLIYNDGLLADYVARKEGVTYQEALKKIEVFVGEVRQKISSGVVFDLEDVGSLRGDAIGNLLFSPGTDSSFMPEAFGLSAFRFEPLNYKQVIKIEKEVYIPSMLQNRSPRYWGTVAALMAGIFFFSTAELKMPTASQAGLAGAFTATEVTYALKSVVDKETELSDDAMDVGIHSSNDLVGGVNKEKVHHNKDKYHLIAASYAKESLALKAVDDFLSKGYRNAKLIDDGSGRYRVALASFEDRDKAVAVLNTYRQQSGFESVWVFSFKS